MMNKFNNIDIDSEIERLQFEAKKDPDAGIQLANIYSRVKKNIDMALYWLEQSYDLGYKHLAIEIANIYNPDNNISPDDELAYEWYSKGSSDGIAECSYILADYYAIGTDSIPRDPIKSIKLYELAGRQGIPNGFTQVACEYITGKSVNRNYAYAKKLLSIAYNQGDVEALKWLNYLEKVVTSNKRIAKREYNPSNYSPILSDSGFTGLVDSEQRCAKKRKAQDEKRRELLHVAAAVNADTSFSYLDVDGGVVFDKNMEIVGIVDENSKTIYGKKGISIYDADTNTTFNAKEGIIYHDKKTRTSYNPTKHEITYHDEDIVIKSNME